MKYLFVSVIISSWFVLGVSSSALGATVKLAEPFDDAASLPSRNWYTVNNSEPLSVESWFQGTPSEFPAHSGAPDSYIAANFNNTSPVGTISNWLITPVLIFENGDRLTFYTRTVPNSLTPDRLEVRLSTNGNGINVGSTATSTGDFNRVVLVINPNLQVGGYPESYTLASVDLDGFDAPTPGRLAFRYYVTDAGPLGNNSNYIGIDTLEVTGVGSVNNTVAVPFEFSATPGLIMLGIWATLYRRSLRNKKQ